MSFGLHLKAARIAKNMSRKELAEQTQHSIHAVKSWELNRHLPPKATIERLETILNARLRQHLTSLDHRGRIAIRRLDKAIKEMPDSPRKENLVIILEQIGKII